MTNCPNCNQKLTDSIWLANKLISEEQIKTINETCQDKKLGYCEKCGLDLFKNASHMIKEKIKVTSSRYNEVLTSIPLITSHSPLGWDYEVIGLVTGQSVTGTGVLSEITSSFTDLLGKQSNRHNEKIKSGENLCATQLRQQVIDQGGNAVLALDIDYSELGGGKSYDNGLYVWDFYSTKEFKCFTRKY